MILQLIYQLLGKMQTAQELWQAQMILSSGTELSGILCLMQVEPMTEVLVRQLTVVRIAVQERAGEDHPEEVVLLGHAAAETAPTGLGRRPLGRCSRCWSPPGTPRLSHSEPTHSRLPHP